MITEQRTWRRRIPDARLQVAGVVIAPKTLDVFYYQGQPMEGGHLFPAQERLWVKCELNKWPQGFLRTMIRGAQFKDVAISPPLEKTIAFGPCVLSDSDIASKYSIASFNITLERFFSPEFDPDDFERSHETFPALRHALQIGPEYQESSN